MSMTKFCMEGCISMCKYSCKKSCCAFSAYQSFNFLVLVLWKCASSIAAVPVAKQSLFPHLTFRRNSWIVSRFWKGRLSFFLKFSIIISTIVEAERGENPFPNPLCARRGEKGGGWCGRAGFVTLWLIYQNQPRHTTLPQQNNSTIAVPKYNTTKVQHYHSTKVKQYHSTKVHQYHSTTLFDLPEPAP